jgi:phosphate transport system substrate-binding protein
MHIPASSFPHAWWKGLISVLAFSLLMGCSSSPSTPASIAVQANAPQVVLEVSGSSQVLPILRAIEPAFEAASKGHQLEVIEVTGSTSGQAAALEGVTKQVLDLAAMSRPLKEKETAQGLEYIEFGRAGVSIFTHPGVGVSSLSDEQISTIFAGKATDWSSFGGTNTPIVVFHREEDATTTLSLREAFLGDTSFSPSAQKIDRTNELMVAVAGTQGSVGYGLWPAALMESTNVQAVALNGVAPNDAAYPIVQPLGISYLTSRKAEMQPLITWLLSPQGQAELRKLGVIATPV